MKSVFKNGKIFVEKGHFVSAMLVTDGKIEKIGTDREAAAWQADETVDLQGKTVAPGFNDSHMHLLKCGFALRQAEMYGLTSIADVIRVCREFLAGHPGLTVLAGRGWNQDYFTDEKRLLTREDLDRITTEIPVVLTRTCGHVAAVNSKAIEMLDIGGSFVVASGGEAGMTDGRANGLLYETAAGQVAGLLAEPLTGENVCAILKDIAAVANAQGITSVSTNDITVGSPTGEAIEEGFLLYAKSNPTLRINHQVSFESPAKFRERIAAGYDRSPNAAFHRYGPLKLFADGSLGARTALLRAPYYDDPATSGVAVLRPAEIAEYVKIADENGIQCMIHGIGNLALDRIMDAYETLTGGGANPLRHGMIHVQITDPAQIERIARLQIPVAVQPVFLHYDLHMAEARVGKKLAATSYAFRTMIDAGIHAGYGTDSPVEPFNPFHCIHCAVNRQDLKGFPVEGWYPAERVGVQEAVAAYTAESAYTTFAEGFKGKLLPGYYADFVVLSEDIFTVASEKIKDIRAQMTVVGGKIAYKAED
ncbi:MAG: amidohydrolase [Fusobacteriaceae bacterium]|jgi:predicted amidohydrolase YtcJ|nr:amidohydrolase [Fusobacteriaceae bacterium]